MYIYYTVEELLIGNPCGHTLYIRLLCPLVPYNLHVIILEILYNQINHQGVCPGDEKEAKEEEKPHYYYPSLPFSVELCK